MTDREIRIEIAETCGWRNVTAHERSLWTNGQGSPVNETDLPDYLNDLNAMNEAEKIIDQMPTDSQSLYLDYLALSTGWSGDTMAKARFSAHYNAVRCPARQRVAAFLKTIGKWRGA